MVSTIIKIQKDLNSAHQIRQNRYITQYIILHSHTGQVVNDFHNFDDVLYPEVEELESKSLHH